MKLFAKLLVLVLIAAMAAPFYLRGPDGRPLMQWSDVTERFKSMMGSGSGSKSGGKVEVHRWQDENGQWHYSDAPSGQNSEIITVDPNVNVVQATPVPAANNPSGDPVTNAPEEDKSVLPPILNPVDETNKVKEELEQRNKELKERLDDT